MGDPEFPYADMFPEQAYDTPTAAEIEEAERIASEWALPEAEATTEVAAETATEFAAETATEVAAEAATEVAAEAAVEGGVFAAEEVAMSGGVVGVAIAAGIAIGAAAGEALWEFDRDVLSAGSHMEDVEDPPSE
jgi:hypothetical protein